MEKIIADETSILENKKFKDAVLEGANIQAKEIIEKAQEKHDKAIETTKQECPNTNYETIAAVYAQKNEQTLATAAQEMQQKLLETRSQEVEKVFAEVEKELMAFTKAPEYMQWLQNKLQPLLALVKNEQTVLFVNKKDMAKAEELKKSLPNSTIQQDGSIQIGGFKLRCKNCLYNETLDEYFKEQQQKFYTTSDLSE